MRKGRRGGGVPASTPADAWQWQAVRRHLASARDAAATVAGWIADRLLLSVPVVAVLMLVMCPCFAMASRDAPTTAAPVPTPETEEGDEEGGAEPPPAKKSSSIKAKVRRWRRKRAPVEAADNARLVGDEGEDSPRGDDAVDTVSGQSTDDLDGSAPQRHDDDDENDEYGRDDADQSGEATKAAKPERIYEL